MDKGDPIDRAARYARCGRRYHALPDHELASRWIEAFRATVRQPEDDASRIAEEELLAEHQLRRLQPPYELVTAERDLLISQITAGLGQLSPGQLKVLKEKRTRRSERLRCEQQLKVAIEALAIARHNVMKQRAIVRALVRRRSRSVAQARAALQQLERSASLCEQTRELYARLLRRWC